MRRDAYVVGFGERSNFFGLEKPAGVGDIRLNYMSRLALQEIQKAEAAIDMFAGGDSHRRSCDHLRHGFIVVSRYWLLAPGRVQRHHRANSFERHDRAKSSMKFQKDIDVLADRLTHCLDGFDRIAQVCSADFSTAGPERVKFQRLVSSRNNAG